jgi:hypothetical protein
MSWGNWILAYLFDCVHPHTTWPRRHRAGFTYVSCLDCGRELPYSLERMKIVTRKELVADRERNAMESTLAFGEIRPLGTDVAPAFPRSVLGWRPSTSSSFRQDGFRDQVTRFTG